MLPAQWLEERFAASAGKDCLAPLDEPVLSFASVWGNAEALARTWAAEGLREGDVVVLSFPNHTSHFLIYLACAIGGFVACPIVHTHPPDLRERLLTAVSPARVLSQPLAWDASLRSTPRPGALSRANRPFLLPFSSGSTGDPKPILLGLQGVLGAAAAFARLTELGETNVVYHVLPMAYMAGILNTFFAPLLAGACVVEGPLFSPLGMASFWDHALSKRVNTLSLTPTIASSLCRITRPGELLDQARARIRQAQCTSAPVPPSLHKQFQEQFGIPLQNCYGMTEIGGPLTFQKNEDAPPWSTLLNELEFRLRGDQGKELWLRSPFQMLGYRSSTGTLDLPTDGEGFLDTGDLAEIRDGKIQIQGRKKDIIIRGGVNVAPGRIEQVLGAAPGVAEVAVVGVPHPFWGEAITAWIVIKEGEQLPESALREYSARFLGPQERPDHFYFLPSLPRSFIGKVLKGELRAQAAARTLGRN